MPETPRTYSYQEFVKELPVAAKKRVTEFLDTTPDEEEFKKFARAWTARCIPPLYYKLAKDLIMTHEADPADLIEGVAQFFSASDIPIQMLVIPAGKFNTPNVIQIIALIVVESFCGYYRKIAEDLAEIAKFKATLERVEHGTETRYRVPPEKKAELKEKLGTTLIDVDVFFKSIEDTTATGQIL